MGSFGTLSVTAREAQHALVEDRPEWLRRQRLAHTVVSGIMAARPRTLTTEQRTLATLLRVDRTGRG